MIRTFTLGLFFAFFLSAFGFLYAFRHVSELMTEEVMALSDEEFRMQYRLMKEEHEQKPPTPSFTQKLIGRNTEWKQYSNPHLGFTLRYPDMAILSSADCDGVYAPVQAFTDNGNSRVFVALAHHFGSTTCATQTVTLKDLQMHHALSPADATWVIDVFPAADDAAMTSFIQRRFGPSCVLGTRSPSDHAGTYDIAIRSDAASGTSPCGAPVAVAFKYSPALQKAALWLTGSGATFSEDAMGTGAFDAKMAESFRWEG